MDVTVTVVGLGTVIDSVDTFVVLWSGFMFGDGVGSVVLFDWVDVIAVAAGLVVFVYGSLVVVGTIVVVETCVLVDVFGSIVDEDVNVVVVEFRLVVVVRPRLKVNFGSGVEVRNGILDGGNVVFIVDGTAVVTIVFESGAVIDRPTVAGLLIAVV